MKKMVFKLIIAVILLFSLATIYNCDTGVLDNVPPDVVIIYPVDGQEVSGTVKIVIAATDDDKLDKTLVFIDGVQVTSSGEKLFEYSWGTGSVADGKVHSIQAVAYDKKGNAGFSTQILVTVVP